MVEIVCHVLQTNHETVHSKLFPLVFDGLVEAGADLSSFLETALCLILCRQGQSMSPGLRALFCGCPFDDQVEFMQPSSPQPKDLSIFDCLLFEPATTFLFALRIRDLSHLEDAPFLQTILLSLENNLYPGLQIYLKEVIDSTPSVRSTRVSPAELEAGFWAAQEEISVLEGKYVERREPVIASLRRNLAELHVIVMEKPIRLRSRPALVELADLQSSKQAFDNEVAWCRLWIPLSQISPESCELRLQRSEQFSTQFIPIKMVPKVERIVNRKPTLGMIKNRIGLLLVHHHCVLIMFDQEFECKMITSTTLMTIVKPDEIFMIPAEDLDLLLRRGPSGI
jgi:hypothetical protein